MTPAALIVALALVPGHGPTIYESGHLPGWHVESTAFFNERTDASVFLPTRRGLPAHPEVELSFTPPHHLHATSRPGTPWRGWIAQFNGPHTDIEAIGQDFPPVVVMPWSTGPATLNPIYHHPKESR